MINLPSEYIDETYGVRPGPNQESFNNIIYSTWYVLAKKLKGTLDSDDLSYYTTHIELNEDKNGLYKPKNSHDNVMYKLIGNKALNMFYDRNISYFAAIWAVGLYRIWDVILISHIKAPKWLKVLLTPLLIIPCIQMILSCKSEGKVRPTMFNSGRDSRILWWFKKKTLTLTKYTRNSTIKTYSIGPDITKTIRIELNDGKHLALFKLFVFQDESFILKQTAKICQKMLVKRYTWDYTYEMINQYFLDENHPVIKEWRDIGNIL